LDLADPDPPDVTPVVGNLEPELAVVTVRGLLIVIVPAPIEALPVIEGFPVKLVVILHPLAPVIDTKE
jgi:hypothetical protein